MEDLEKDLQNPCLQRRKRYPEGLESTEKTLRFDKSLPTLTPYKGADVSTWLPVVLCHGLTDSLGPTLQKSYTWPYPISAFFRSRHNQKFPLEERNMRRETYLLYDKVVKWWNPSGEADRRRIPPSLGWVKTAGWAGLAPWPHQLQWPPGTIFEVTTASYLPILRGVCAWTQTHLNTKHLCPSKPVL